MKKILPLFCTLYFVLCTFALTDTDHDGVSDEKDICPRVYSRSENGCPKIAPSTYEAPKNPCILQKMKEGFIIATIVPICEKGQECPKISKVTGFQSCDPIFPVIFDHNNAPLIRGTVFIVDYLR